MDRSLLDHFETLTQILRNILEQTELGDLPMNVDELELDQAELSIGQNSLTLGQRLANTTAPEASINGDAWESIYNDDYPVNEVKIDLLFIASAVKKCNISNAQRQSIDKAVEILMDACYKYDDHGYYIAGNRKHTP